jgi:hypothetical protein
MLNHVTFGRGESPRQNIGRGLKYFMKKRGKSKKTKTTVVGRKRRIGSTEPNGCQTATVKTERRARNATVKTERRARNMLNVL